MPLISQSKVLNFLSVLPADHSTSSRHLRPGQCASASRASLDTERLAGKQLNGTWHETFAKLHLREVTEEEGQRGGVACEERGD